RYAVQGAEIGNGAVPGSVEIDEVCKVEDVRFNAALAGGIDHRLRGIEDGDMDSGASEVQGIFACAAAEVENAGVWREERIDVAPDRFALQASDGGVGPELVVSGCEL